MNGIGGECVATIVTSLSSEDWLRSKSMSMSTSSFSAVLPTKVGKEAKDTGEPVEFGECAEVVEREVGLHSPVGKLYDGSRNGSV